jgi:hypothetical protein
MTQQIAGHCHCEAIRVILEPSKPLGELPLRACQCSFCRTRGALTTADPAGHLFVEAAPGSINRYQFGLKITDFLLCEECGTYVAATMDLDGQPMGVLNVRGVDLPGFEGRTPDPMIYGDESPRERAERRRDRWMPLTLVEVQPSI